MKTRIVDTRYLLEIWKMSIETMFFPDVLFNELRPDKQIEVWGDKLSYMREQLRSEVDAFIERLFEYNECEELWKILRKTDPRIVSLYFDRLNVATLALKDSVQGQEFVMIPDSWPTFVAQALFQKMPQ